MSEKTPTREKILETAEALFAEKGLDGTSMRNITDAAGVNLASVNYHFGSKDGLIAAVFDRHLIPLRNARLAMLEAAESKAADAPPALEAIMEAFIRPAVVRALDPRQGKSFMRLMGRCLTEPEAYAEKFIYPHFEALIIRFNAVVARAVPDLSHDEIFWRVGFVAGGLHYAIHMASRVDRFPVKLEKAPDGEALIRRLISFAAAGFRNSDGGESPQKLSCS